MLVGEMKRWVGCAWLGASLAVAACSGDDSNGVDASIDQSTPDATKEAAAPDASADVASDAPVEDAPVEDAAADVALDAPSEAEPEDAAADASIDVNLDAGGCVTNADCSAKEYCNKADGECGGAGTCKATPQICPQFISPVCGCDHKTYGNYCFAEQARTNVDHNGACP